MSQPRNLSSISDTLLNGTPYEPDFVFDMQTSLDLHSNPRPPRPLSYYLNSAVAPIETPAAQAHQKELIALKAEVRRYWQSHHLGIPDPGLDWSKWEEVRSRYLNFGKNQGHAKSDLKAPESWSPVRIFFYDQEQFTKMMRDVFKTHRLSALQDGWIEGWKVEMRNDKPVLLPDTGTEDAGSGKGKGKGKGKGRYRVKGKIWKVDDPVHFHQADQYLGMLYKKVSCQIHLGIEGQTSDQGPGEGVLDGRVYTWTKTTDDGHLRAGKVESAVFPRPKRFDMLQVRGP